MAPSAFVEGLARISEIVAEGVLGVGRAGAIAEDRRVGCQVDSQLLHIGRQDGQRPRRERCSCAASCPCAATPTACHGHPGQAYCTGLALAEWLCRTADRID